MSRPTRVLLCVLVLSQVLLLCATTRAAAGVIIWKEYTPQRDELIQIIQGHKEWLVRGPIPQHISQAPSAVVDDLDKGIRTQIDYVRKTYTQEPFPEPVAGVNGNGISELKPTGKLRKIAGYSCEEYTGSGDSAHWGHSTEVDCVSKDAPGVAEYNQFTKLLDRLLVDAGYGESPQGISGIPLASTGDCCGGPSGFVVTKIESKAIPPSQFEPPAGFVKVKPPGKAPAASEDPSRKDSHGLRQSGR